MVVVVSGRMQREEWQKLRRLRSSRGRVQVEPFLRYRSLFFLLVGRAWTSTRHKLQWGNRRAHHHHHHVHVLQRCWCSVSNHRGRRARHHHHAHGSVDGEVQLLRGGVATLVELEVRLLWADHLAADGGAVVGLRRREARG